MFVGAVVVADQAHVEVLGDLLVDLGEELAELRRAVPAVQAGDHRAVGGVERYEQVSRAAVTDTIVGAFLRHPGIIGNVGWDRAKAWTCDFSSTHSTTAASGGLT